MKADIRIPLHVNEYAASTMHLSAEGHGVYLLLVCHYCQHGYIPDDPKKYTRISRTNAEATESILEDFFIKDESGAKWTHNSLDAELQKVQKRREAARERTRTKRRSLPEKKRPPENTRISSGPVQNKPTRDRPQAQSGYNPKLANNKLVVNSSPPPVPKKTSKAAAMTEPRAPDKELYQKIKTIFEGEQPGNQFTSYPKEGTAIKQLLTKAKARDPTNPDVFLLGMIDRFRKMRREDDFIRRHPFLPSALNATWLWDRILSEAWQKHKEQKEYEALEAEGTTLPWRFLRH